MLSGLVIACSFVGPTAISEANDGSPKCQVSEPTTGPSDQIRGGTMITYTAKCEQRETVTTEVTIKSGDSLLSKATDEITVSGDLSLTNSLHLPAPSGAEACVTVGETQVCTQISLLPGAGPDPNKPPNASFDTNCVDLTCKFTDTSRDPDADGSIRAWTWDFGDGESISKEEPNDPTHSYSAAGDYEVLLTVTDNRGATDSTTRSVTVYAPLTIDTTSLPAAKKKVAYSTNLEASGGKPSYSWSVASGTLPKGLSLASDGALSGTPKTPGTYSFTVQVVDAQEPSKSASRTLTLQVTPR